eukprot:7327476-Pyramimonas_sp.AAC.1
MGANRASGTKASRLATTKSKAAGTYDQGSKRIDKILQCPCRALLGSVCIRTTKALRYYHVVEPLRGRLCIL